MAVHIFDFLNVYSVLIGPSKYSFGFISVLNFDLYVFCVDIGRCFVHIVRA